MMADMPTFTVFTVSFQQVYNMKSNLLRFNALQLARLKKMSGKCDKLIKKIKVKNAFRTFFFKTGHI